MPALVSAFKPDRFPIYTAGLEAVKEYASGERIKHTAPRVRLVISPFIPPYVPIEILGQDMGDLITSVSFEKSRSQPAGSFSVTMVADDQAMDGKISGQPLKAIWKTLGSSLEDLFKSMTLANLYMDGYLVGTGKLTSMKRQVSTSGKSYTLQFHELGALYEQNTLSSGTILYGVEENITINPLARFATIQSLTGYPISTALHELTQAFIETTLSYNNQGPFRLSDGLPLAYRLISRPAPFGGIANNTLMANINCDISMMTFEGGGSFWEYLKGLIKEPICELWTETGGRTICLGPVGQSSSSGGEQANVSNVLQVAEDIVQGNLSLQNSGVNIAALMPGFNYMCMRSTPYNNPLTGGFGQLDKGFAPYTMGVFDLITGGDFIIVTDDMVISKDLGWSEANQFTLFQSRLDSGGDSGDMGWNDPSIAHGPLLPIYPGGIRTYGVRVYTFSLPAYNTAWEGILAQTSAETIKKTDGTSGTVNVGVMSRLLNLWFRNGAKYKEGSIETTWIPYARPGMLLLYLPSLNGTAVENPRDIAMYYIDNVSHSWNLGQTPTTNFTLCRGTPLPLNAQNVAVLFAGWEIFPVVKNTQYAASSAASANTAPSG